MQASGSHVCKCGETMVVNPPGTPEQEFCGTWYVCPHVQARPQAVCNSKEHTASILVPSEGLRAQWRQMASA